MSGAACSLQSEPGGGCAYSEQSQRLDPGDTHRPSGGSWPPEKGTAKKGVYPPRSPPLPCSSLLWGTAEAPVSVPVPVPSWDGPGRPNSCGLMLMSVFPRHLSERGRVPVRAGRGTGHLPSCHHSRLSP